MKWANRLLNLITIGSAIYCIAFFLSWAEQTWQTCYFLVLMTISGENDFFGSCIPRHRLKSVIAKYSKHPHRCGDWQQHIHLKTLDSSALEPCQSTAYAGKIIPQETAIPGFQTKIATKRQNLRTAALKGSYYAFSLCVFSQCVVCMFGHKTIYKVTNLKVHSKGRYFVLKNPFSRTTTNGSFGLQSCFPVFVISQK